MRSDEEVRRVHELAALGLNRCEIARRTGIPRSTVRHWLTKQPRDRIRPRRPSRIMLPPEAYSYLFGLYLGDGWLRSFPKDVYQLEISLDSGYPGIVAECARAMSEVMPKNKVAIDKHRVHNLNWVRCYSKHWPHLLPQHGPGMKHTRPILLDPWQVRILEGNVEQLLRGLIHSDGCRARNKVNGKVYPRYMFSNRSLDIQAIFTGACDALGIHWTRNYKWSISVARRRDVALLDSFIGPKS